MKLYLRLLSIPLVCVLLAGCASYGSKMEETRMLFSQRKYDGALEKLEEAKSGRSQLLYLLEKGMILHYAGRYNESNDAFEEAEILAEDLYTKSISKELGAFLTSDNILHYEGEKFERALIHYYRAFNYIYLKLPDDALVECRKVSFLLQQYLDESADKTSAYSDDAFMNYLAGMLFEWQGERNDAFISYRKAEEAYEKYAEVYSISPPSSLSNDLIRTANDLGFAEEYEQYLRKYGDSYIESETIKESGELVLIHENGFAPNKEAIEIVFPILKKDKLGDNKSDVFEYSKRVRTRANRHYDEIEVEYMLRVSIPKYESSRPQIAYAEVLTSGAASVKRSFELVEDVEAIAFKNFIEEEPKIILKTLARGIAKYLAFKTARKKSGEVAGLLVNVFNIATEGADTRSWLTLPNSFGIARMSLPPGEYNLHLSFRDSNGREVKSAEISNVEIRKNDFTFLTHRTFQ